MKRTHILAAVNIMGGLNFGYNTGVIAGILTIWEDLGKEWHLSEAMQGIVTASILIGALVGSMIGGPIADHFGRKKAVLLLAIITLTGAPFLAAAPNVWVVIGARAFLGLAVGMSGVICPMYVSESAPPESKGQLGILFQVAITVGILHAYLFNYALKNIKYNWRVMFGCGAYPGLFLLAVWAVMPESPVWSLRRGVNNNETASLLKTNETEPPLGARLGIFIRSRALYIGLVLAVAQQLTGINAFMYYAGKVFGSAGISNPNYPTIGLGAWNAVSTLVGIPLVDRLGRRPLLVAGTLIMTVACFGLGVVYKYTHGDAKGYLAIGLLFIFVLAFEIGDGPLFWIVAHELFTPEIKTVGASTLNAAQWLFNIALTLGFPTVDKLIGSNVFYIFGLMGAIATIVLVIFLPETRNTAKN